MQKRLGEELRTCAACLVRAVHVQAFLQSANSIASNLCYTGAVHLRN